MAIGLLCGIMFLGLLLLAAAANNSATSSLPMVSLSSAPNAIPQANSTPTYLVPLFLLIGVVVIVVILIAAMNNDELDPPEDDLEQ